MQTPRNIASPKSNNLIQKRSVALSSLTFLHAEMVQYIRLLCNDDKDQAMKKLEEMGYQAGYRLAERFTVAKPRFLEALDVIKFICKEMWKYIFNKHIDKLQTNYKGVYVIHDFSFIYLKRLSTKITDEELLKAECLYYIQFTSGLLKGALSNLGINTTVKAEISTIPKCHFTIVDHQFVS